MDVSKLLGSINNITDYILATEEVSKCENLKIPLTISVILNLKRKRSLEIEYFNKCEGNGVTFLVFEKLLKQPPSQTWRLLGKELIPMVHYWLEAVRKHLISHNPRWWSFLATLLNFIQEIKLKDHALTNIVVEQTIECLLDLACNSQLDELQRDKVLRCVNLCCADCSRELRAKMVDRLNTYFIKLAAVLASCGHLPTQMAVMELLLRWLLRRHDAAVRATAAAAWFPKQLFSGDTVEVFLKATWREFYQDSRRFLNCHNSGREPRAVTSVLCSDLCVGRVALLEESSEVWLDVNSATRSITIYLDLRDADDPTKKRFDVLSVPEDNTVSVEMKRISGQTYVALHTVSPLQLSVTSWSGDHTSLRLRVHEPAPLDRALRAHFRTKYLGFVDYDTDTGSLPIERPKMSGAPAPQRHRSGSAVRSRGSMVLSSPSSVSTTSLAQLRDKLAALPPLQCSRVTQKVSATPELAAVRELSEGDEPRARRLGVAVKHLSDSEAAAAPKNKFRSISPVVKDNSASLLLVAALETADESVINNTFDKIYNNGAEVDLLDLLVEEALNNGQEKDSGIVCGKKTQETDVIEDTPVEKNIRHKLTLKHRAKNNTKTGESDSDVIEDTPCYVYDRRKTVQTGTYEKVTDGVTGDEIITLGDKFEEFFSQHVSQHEAGNLVVSPKLAKKINETSSSDYLSDNNVFDDVDDVACVFEEEIIECLDNILDKVCEDIDQCAVLFEKQQRQIENLTTVTRDKTSSIAPDVSITHDSELLYDDTTNSTEYNKKVTLKFQKSKTRTRVSKMNTKQKKSKRVGKPKNIEEDKIEIENTNTNSPVNTTKEAELTRKKRKLYSPKDDDADYEVPRTKMEKRQSNTCETPIAACYKELEKARRTQSRLTRRTRASTEPLASPKTKKLNDMFDKIRENVVNNEEIMLVKKPRSKKDFAVYNLSSESEEENFQLKKLRVQQSSSSLEMSATKRGKKVRNRKSVFYEDKNISSSESEVKKTRKTKMTKTTKNTKPRSRKLKIDQNTNLIDEKMRDAAPEVLETSFVGKADQHIVDELEVPAPSLKQVPAMEMLTDNLNDVEPDILMAENKSESPKKLNVKIKKEKCTNKKTEKITKSLTDKKGRTLKNKEMTKDVPNEKDSSTVSPLPGLVVETVQSRKDDLASSIDANLMQKFKNIYTEVNELNDTGGTQNMLGEENFICIMGEDNFNDDAVIGSDPNEGVIVVSDMASGKSISTLGRSPITGHNDFNEPPPNLESLDETIQHRDLDIQGMNQSLAEFVVNMRAQLNCTKPITVSANKTSPVLPISRMSTRERALSVMSNTSVPQVVLTRLPSDAVTTGANQTVTPRSNLSSGSNKTMTKVASNKLPPVGKESNQEPARTKTSEEDEKYSSPVKSQNRSSMRSVSVVLKRISSDEMDKWLPIPQSKQAIEENPKKYNTRQASTSTGVTKRTPEKVAERKMKSIISPIKLSFDIAEITETRGNRSLKRYRTRSSTRSIKSVESQATQIDKDKFQAIIIDRQKSSSDKMAEESTNRDDVQVTSQETVLKSSADTTDRLRKVQKPVSSVDASEANVTTSGISKRVASVNEWFDKNASSPVISDNVAAKQVLEKVMETVDTTLVEIHQSTGENLSRAHLELQKDINQCKELMLHVCEELERKQKEFKEHILHMCEELERKQKECKEHILHMCEGLERKQKERACEILRADAEKKEVMVTILKEDMQAIFDFFNKQDK